MLSSKNLPLTEHSSPAMNLRILTSLTLIVPLLIQAVGCRPSSPIYLREDGELRHYRDVATQIEYADVETDRIAEVSKSNPPLTIAMDHEVKYWELSLDEAIQNALCNSKVMRSIGGSVVPAPSTLTTAPQAVASTYGPAVVESNPLIGTEGALSAFDAQFTSRMFWNKNDRPQNLSFAGIFNPVFQQDTADFLAEVSKPTATGGQAFFRNVTRYDLNNNFANRFSSSYVLDMEVEYRHPLLQGAGAQFNRIAGPNAIVGQYRGIALARVNTDIALADFELAVRNLLADVELAYWELYFAYRNLDAVVAGRDGALQTWRRINALYTESAIGGEADKEAQAREQYYLFRAQAESGLTNVYRVETRLRYLMGLAATDGRLIRPANSPTSARIRFDWFEVHYEAMANNTELRRQKWTVKQRELELLAARNFLLPRLDIAGIYRWKGFGDHLIAGPNPAFNSAARTLWGGDFQEWQMGVDFSLPVGFRRQLAGVRFAELQLARERAVLQDQELEISHQLADALRDMDGFYAVAQTNFNRRVAAERRVEAVRAAYEAGSVTLDVLTESQRFLVEAETAYYRALVDYNLALRTVHVRKGSLLAYNNVSLNEGPWPQKAYRDANERARERDAALVLNYGLTRPYEFSRGANQGVMPILVPSNRPVRAIKASEESDDEEELDGDDSREMDSEDEEANPGSGESDSEMENEIPAPSSAAVGQSASNTNHWSYPVASHVSSGKRTAVQRTKRSRAINEEDE